MKKKVLCTIFTIVSNTRAYMPVFQYVVHVCLFPYFFEILSIKTEISLKNLVTFMFDRVLMHLVVKQRLPFPHVI